MITKKELVELLNQFEDNEEIFLAYPASDYWHNIIVSGITNVKREYIEYNEYFQSNVIAKPLDQEDIETENFEYAPVINFSGSAF